MWIKKVFSKTLVFAILIVPTPSYPNDIDKYSDDHADNDDGSQRYILWQKLPEEKRKLLKNYIKSAHGQNDFLCKRAEKLMQMSSATLTAPSFDKGAYLNTNAKLGAINAKMNANISEAFADAASQFNPEERKILEKLNEIRHYHPYTDEFMEECLPNHEEDTVPKPQAE